LVGNQYNLLLSFYYIVTILFGPLLALSTKIWSAKYAIPTMMFGFGISSAATAAVKNFGGAIACRMIVGFFESGFLAS